MDEGSDFRKWDELIPDALGLIFKNLSLLEVLTVVPRVCKSWERAVMGPYCWQEIDIEEWSTNRKPEIVDRMLRLLIPRSCGSLRKLSFSGLAGDESIFFIANQSLICFILVASAQSLQTLRLPRSKINDSVMERAAGMLSTISFLDLSYCINIGAPALEAVGKYCKSLTTLRRVMHPVEVIEKLSQDDEALAIAATMPRLKHLEITYLLVDTSSVVEILKNCNQLELLDVRGCWNVSLDEEFMKRFPRLKVVGPLVEDYCDMNRWDTCSDYSGSSAYLAWDFVAGDYAEMSDDFWEDEHQIEDVEMRFYNDVNVVDAGYDWPQSP
ncbi:F-box protein FBW2 [Sesamum angolense]|uniref:F-box protein FBW2 n=1 Tax=Sesamum angolense TaxID=2727404 RepID=A0AAE1XHT1_9LAMI|nr:F-box protein FBW2 [Sesamum angolense]